MHYPNKECLKALYQVLKYLKGSPRKGLMFRSKNNFQIEAYTDVDWTRSITNRRTTLGYYSFIGGNLVTWRSKKQYVVARISVEARFKAATHGICELWLKKLLEDLRIPSKKPMTLYRNNKAAIIISHNLV